MTTAVFCFIFLFLFMQLHYLAWFLLFHLAYYSISHRIDILSSFVETIDFNEKKKMMNYSQSNHPSLRVRKLRTCAYIFDRICLASREMNSTFSLSVLLNLFLLMILCSTSLFFFIYATTAPAVPIIIKSQSSYFFYIFLGSLQFIIFILLSAESPVKKVEFTIRNAVPLF